MHRVCLLYSGGLDTSVMLKWIQDEYEAEVVTLTVNLGQPGEDYEVVEGKAKQLGAVETRRRSTRARSSPTTTSRRRSRPTRSTASATRCSPRSGRPLIAKLAVEFARQHRLRHDRARLHRQGQRPGPHRGDDRDARARAEGDRAGPRLGDGPRRGDRVRPPARHPGQGRHRDAAVLDRRQPLGPLVGGQLDRGPRATRPRTTSSSSSRGPRTRPTSPRSSSVEFERGVPVALNGERLGLVELLERAAEIGCRHGVGIVDHIEDRIVGLKVRDIYEVPAAAIILPAHAELERLVGTIHQNQFKPQLDQQWAYLVYAGLWWEPLRARPRRLHGRRSTSGHRHDRAQALQGLGARGDARVAERRLRRAAGDLRPESGGAVLPAGVARVHRAVVAAVASRMAAARRSGK